MKRWVAVVIAAGLEVGLSAMALCATVAPESFGVEFRPTPAQLGADLKPYVAMIGPSLPVDSLGRVDVPALSAVFERRVAGPSASSGQIYAGLALMRSLSRPPFQDKLARYLETGGADERAISRQLKAYASSFALEKNRSSRAAFSDEIARLEGEVSGAHDLDKVGQEMNALFDGESVVAGAASLEPGAATSAGAGRKWWPSSWRLQPFRPRQPPAATVVSANDVPTVNGAPTVAVGAFNALNLEEVSNAVRRLEQARSDESAPFSKGAATADNPKMRKFLSDLGRAAQLRGPVVFYPFGGFDVYFPFTTVPGVTDVVAQGSDPFGSVEDLRALLEFKQIGTFLGPVGLGAFDGIRGFWELQYDAKVKSGLGGWAVARVIGALGGHVDAVHYFKFGDDGRIQFMNQDQVADEKNDGNAVIVFTDPKTGVQKRFWYIQHGYLKDGTRAQDAEGYSRFVSRLPFQTLFIKASPGMYDNDELPKKARADVIRDTLVPAKRNNARVIADQELNNIDRKSNRRPIWKGGTGPSKIQLRDGQRFGYSGPGDDVYFSDAQALIDPETPTSSIPGYHGAL